MSSPTFRQRGFTLIEILVTLAIVGILAAIAIPAFGEQLQKGRRVDAASQLHIASMGQERWRASHATYGDAADIGMPAQTEGGYYALAVTANTATGYTMTATPQAAQADDRCGTLTYAFDGTAAIGSQVSRTPAEERCW